MNGVDNVRVFCFTSDKYLWAIKGFARQMGKYWPGIETVVVGFTEPDFDLPENFSFYSVGKFEDYPADKWSDAVIEFLSGVEDEIFILMLEDYWLTRKVDERSILSLEWYMQKHLDVACIDLTTDRLYGENLKDYQSLSYLDLVINDPPAPYHFSLQSRMWRKSEILRYLNQGESPWETELNGSLRMYDNDAIVLGTRQIPVRYLIAVQGGKVALDGGYQVPGVLMRESDKSELEKTIPAVKEIMLGKTSELAKSFGYLHPDEVAALAGAVQLIPENGTMINIGAGAGTSSLLVAESRPDVHIITVDIAETGPAGGLESEYNAFNQAGMGDQLPEQILGDSKEIGKTWDREKVDFIFVDGDHGDEGVRGDIDAWLQHIKDGGIIAFHDYGGIVWPAVTVAVDEMLNKYKAILNINTLKAFRV